MVEPKNGQLAPAIRCKCASGLLIAASAWNTDLVSSKDIFMLESGASNGARFSVRFLLINVEYYGNVAQLLTEPK